MDAERRTYLLDSIRADDRGATDMTDEERRELMAQGLVVGRYGPVPTGPISPNVSLPANEDWPKAWTFELTCEGKKLTSF